MESIHNSSHPHERTCVAQPGLRPVARPTQQPHQTVQPRQVVIESRQVDHRVREHPVYTVVSVERTPPPPVYRDPVRVPPPIEVTWQSIMPYSQNITGQLFDFYDTDTQGNSD